MPLVFVPLLLPKYRLYLSVARFWSGGRSYRSDVLVGLMGEMRLTGGLGDVVARLR